VVDPDGGVDENQSVARAFAGNQRFESRAHQRGFLVDARETTRLCE